MITCEVCGGVGYSERRDPDWMRRAPDPSVPTRELYTIRDTCPACQGRGKIRVGKQTRRASPKKAGQPNKLGLQPGPAVLLGIAVGAVVGFVESSGDKPDAVLTAMGFGFGAFMLGLLWKLVAGLIALGGIGWVAVKLAG